MLCLQQNCPAEYLYSDINNISATWQMPLKMLKTDQLNAHFLWQINMKWIVSQIHIQQYPKNLVISIADFLFLVTQF